MTDEHKRLAAEKSVEWVKSGMVVGLGAGSTAAYAVRRIGELLKKGTLQGVVGIPCSREVERLAQAVGIPLTTLEAHPSIDLTIDGADEIDPQLNLIKGGGGALLHEKIVARASKREIIAAEEAKLSPFLGTRWAVPVEIVPFGWHQAEAYIKELGAREIRLRMDGGAPYLTDEGNTIVDCNFGAIENPEELAERLKALTGIVEHGLFIGLATDVILAGPNGVRHLTRT